MTKTPNLTSADAYNADVLASATKFAASLFIGRGKYANAEADTLEEIQTLAEKLKADHPTITSRPIITAFDEGGNTAVLGGKAKPAKKKPAPKGPAKSKPAKAKVAAAKVAKPAKAAKPAKVKADKPAKAPKADKPAGKRADMLASAEAGNLPTAPDFSAPTHARFLKKHAELVALVDAGDLKALKAFPINPISSSPKALARYRDLAVTALEAQAKAAKAKAKEAAE